MKKIVLMAVKAQTGDQIPKLASFPSTFFLFLFSFLFFSLFLLLILGVGGGKGKLDWNLSATLWL